MTAQQPLPRWGARIQDPRCYSTEVHSCTMSRSRGNGGLLPLPSSNLLVSPGLRRLSGASVHMFHGLPDPFCYRLTEEHSTAASKLQTSSNLASLLTLVSPHILPSRSGQHDYFCSLPRENRLHNPIGACTWNQTSWSNRYASFSVPVPTTLVYSPCSALSEW